MAKVRVLGNDWCPYCVKIKNFLQTNKVPYDWIDTETYEGKQERSKVSAKEKYNTIPMVYVDDKFIGGCNEFFAALNKKKINLGNL